MIQDAFKNFHVSCIVDHASSINMSEIRIKLPDGEIKGIPKGITIGEIFRYLGIRDSVIGAKVNGRLVDFWYELDSDSAFEPVTLNSTAGLDLIRHTAAHVMAEAVQSIDRKSVV